MDRESVGPTYFEITTAMAFLHFSNNLADATVLEVGLGGRLDSTNVCLPELAVITSISRDHTRQLGSRLEDIAKEKAGIVKPGIPVISGVTNPPARKVISEICAIRKASLRELNKDFSDEFGKTRVYKVEGDEDTLFYWNSSNSKNIDHTSVLRELTNELLTDYSGGETIDGWNNIMYELNYV